MDENASLAIIPNSCCTIYLNMLGRRKRERKVSRKCENGEIQGLNPHL